MDFESAIPIFRMFDERKAVEFYESFLGFSIDWRHGEADNFPLYMQISKGSVHIHLSEHHGDGCPGARLRIKMRAVEEYQRQLVAKDYKYMKPGVEMTDWGAKEITVIDPFGNTIIFWEQQ